jgi:hydrogenase large subunit
MSKIITIDPVTRIEGHLKIKIDVDETVDKPVVNAAWSSGTLFRGLEALMGGRDPFDAPLITSRVCGVCPVPHSIASVLALDDALNATVPDNGRILRNISLASNFLWSHILHFYTLTIQDFAAGPNMPPWTPQTHGDIRFNEAQNAEIIGHYVQALEMVRKTNEMCAIFGGKSPHTPAIVSGGFTGTVTAQAVAAARTYIEEIDEFVTNVYLPDIYLLGQTYPDYFTIGKGYGNLLSMGVFNTDSSGGTMHAPGVALNGSASVQAFDPAKITEDIASSYYTGDSGPVSPFDTKATDSYPKDNAYSWIKSPRYNGIPVEVGPLARMWMSGKYTRGISVMDRHTARAEEAKVLTLAVIDWLDQLVPGKPAYIQTVLPKEAAGFSMTEATRGSLSHYVKIKDRKISLYQIITPTCWNASPRDTAGRPGALEKAIEGTVIASKTEPVEVLRIIHSFDPCLACAVH